MSGLDGSPLREVEVSVISAGLTTSKSDAVREVFIRECDYEGAESLEYGGAQFRELFSPEAESREESRERLERITKEQKSCWGMPHDGLCLNMSLANERRRCPDWLDADLLFRINYGEADRQDVARLKEAILGSHSADVQIERKQRACVTLLDRLTAQKLYQALFPRADWKTVFATDSGSDSKQYPQRLTPFDYDESNPLIYPLLWTEEFIVDNVWNDQYSKQVLGGNSRPPMYAVVLDMILLLQFLQKNPEKPRTVYDVLSEFAKSHRLLSVGHNIDIDWAARGYLADLFNIVTCVRYLARDDRNSSIIKVHPAEILGWDYNEKGGPRTWPERRIFPGADSLRIPRPYYDPRQSMGPLEDFNAAFICSGPFRFTFTTRLAEHLTFNQNREIRLFFDGEYSEFNFPGFPGEVLKPYEQHTLGRSLTKGIFG